MLILQTKGVINIAHDEVCQVLTDKRCPYVISVLFKSIGPMTVIRGVAIFESRPLIGCLAKTRPASAAARFVFSFSSELNRSFIKVKGYHSVWLDKVQSVPKLQTSVLFKKNKKNNRTYVFIFVRK